MRNLADRTIEIIIDVADKTKGKLDGVKNSLLAMDRTAQQLANKFKSFATLKYSTTLRLIDEATPAGSRIRSFLQSLGSRAYNAAIRINDSPLGKIRQIQTALTSLASKAYTASIGIKDSAFDKVRQIQTALTSLASRTYNATIRITDSVLGKVRQVEAALMRLAGRAYTVGINLRDNVSSKLGGIANGALMSVGAVGGAMGIGYGAANAVSSYADFEKNMSRVQAVGLYDKNSPEFQALKSQANELGMNTVYTAAEIAQAQYYQKMAGWDTEKVLAATPAIANLAAAADAPLKMTSDMLTDTMTALHINAGETYRDKGGRIIEVSQGFADLLAKTVTSSNTDLAQLSESLKYSANVFGGAFATKDIQTRMQAAQDLLVMTGLQANAGIKGSMSGTGNKEFFNRMASMNQNAERALDMLGVRYKDDFGDMLLPGQIMRQMHDRMKNGADVNRLLDFAEEMEGTKMHAQTRRKLSSFIEQTLANKGEIGSADMLKLMSMVGGAEHMGKVLSMSLGDWDALASKIEDANGAAAKMADIQLDNLSGDVARLTSAWDGFQRGLFEGQAGDGLRSFVQSLTEMINHANKLFSDGIQIGDFGKIIGDVFGRLKNKFLEFDGVGSILAGGALMAGLTKIASTAQRTIGYLKQLKAAEIGQHIGGTSTARGLPAGQSVGTINVSAGVVNVNGKVGGGVGGRNVGNQAIIDRYNAQKERIRGGSPVPPVISPFAGMGSAAMGGAIFAGIFGLMDVMNTRAMSQERLASAKEAVSVAQKEYDFQRTNGASIEALREYASAVQNAQMQQAQIVRENQAAEFRAGTEAATSVIGTAIGAGLGSLLAGPFGTMVGGIIGGVIGEKLGGFLADEHGNRGNQLAKPEVNEAVIDKAVEQRLSPTTFEFKNPLSREVHDRTGLMQTKFFEPGEEIAETVAQVKREMSVADFRRANELSYSPEFKERHRAELDAADHARWVQDFYGEQARRTHGGEFAFNNAAADYYREQRENFKPPEPFDFTKALSDFFGGENRAYAAELNETQLAQQAAMERGESLMPQSQFPEPVTPEKTELPEPALDVESVTENLYSQLEGLQEGIGELFTGLGETITENLTTAFEGAGEIFSTFGTTITEGLTSSFEGVGEIFSGLSEQINAGLEGAMTAATSSLEGIQNSFTSAKEAIQTSWAELPSFFSGVFSGLGGAAEAAGAAILSGLTSVCGAVIGAWQSVASTVSGIIASIQSAASSVASMIPSFGGGVGKAEGGFVSAETHFFAGEHGAEVVIPLSSSRRARALDLFEKTARILGGEALSFGGDELPAETFPELDDNFGTTNAALSADVPINEASPTQSQANSISMGGVNVTFEISGAENPQEVLETIRENLADLTDRIAAQLSKTIGAVHANQPLEV